MRDWFQGFMFGFAISCLVDIAIDKMTDKHQYDFMVGTQVSFDGRQGEILETKYISKGTYLFKIKLKDGSTEWQDFNTLRGTK